MKVYTDVIGHLKKGQVDLDFRFCPWQVKVDSEIVVADTEDFQAKITTNGFTFQWWDKQWIWNYGLQLTHGNSNAIFTIDQDEKQVGVSHKFDFGEAGVTITHTKQTGFNQEAQFKINLPDDLVLYLQTDQEEQLVGAVKKLSIDQFKSLELVGAQIKTSKGNIEGQGVADFGLDHSKLRVQVNSGDHLECQIGIRSKLNDHLQFNFGSIYDMVKMWNKDDSWQFGISVEVDL